MLKRILYGCSMLLVCNLAQAQILTQWNFNSSPPDANNATGSTAPNMGAGAATLTGGVIAAAFFNGDSEGGSSDPTIVDDSSWSISSFPLTGANKTAGVSFSVSTVGFSNVSISYDLHHSGTSSRFEQVQYSIDGGSNWIDAALFDAFGLNPWAIGRSVDLSSIAAVNNNANFAFRIVAAVNPGGASYLASAPGFNYFPNGSWSFDMVTVNAVAMPVPEPSSWALMFGGLAAVGFLAARRR